MAIAVPDCNVADSTTVEPQVQRVHRTSGIRDFVVLKNRGMITQSATDAWRPVAGIQWITARKKVHIRPLVEGGSSTARASRARASALQR